MAVRASLKLQLEIAIKALNKHKRDVEEDRDRILVDKKKTALFVSAFKPSSLMLLGATFAAFNRGLSRLDGTIVAEFFGVEVKPNHRAAENFVAVSASVEVSDAPSDVENLGLLMDWISASGVFFRKARPAHMLLLKSFGILTKGIDAQIAALEAKEIKMEQADLGEMETLVRLAGIPISAVKSPAGGG